MSVTILSLVLLAGALLACGLPLWRGTARPLGRGLEDDAPLHRWESERTRLIGQLQDNDMALAEGRVTPAAHAATATRLGEEAEAVMDRLRAARRAFAPTEHAPPPGRAGTALALVATAALTVGSAYLARWQDIDLVGSPHADGRVPIDIAGAMPADGGLGAGAPDIGAMVAGLEARVAEGGASADEIKMLLRSYDTLGRIEEARAVLDAAIERFPNDPEFRLGWLRAAVSVPQPDDGARALALAEGLIAEMPDLLEAHWYRGLYLIEADRTDEARNALMWLAPRLPAESPAHRAVAARLEALAGAAN
ncbi:MAG: hypothetical protein CVT70_15280 [Alphaproteobacteria bacterium HGW-Alphaproteobacteria-1]|jgi:cytochrome c-type biogenesis protein CcmH|nr:MAG: hypothetical protein CVT70_15280 [Alphaproteobacteria bacterium HGW-Alphaproteobacteria-1]